METRFVEEKNPKVGRTVKLEHDLNERLINLCEHLGVNPNAYLLNEIGKAISRDEVTYNASKHTSSMQQQFAEMMSLMMELPKDQEK